MTNVAGKGFNKKKKMICVYCILILPILEVRFTTSVDQYLSTCTR